MGVNSNVKRAGNRELNLPVAGEEQETRSYRDRSRSLPVSATMTLLSPVFDQTSDPRDEG